MDTTKNDKVICDSPIVMGLFTKLFILIVFYLSLFILWSFPFTEVVGQLIFKWSFFQLKSCGYYAYIYVYS